MILCISSPTPLSVRHLRRGPSFPRTEKYSFNIKLDSTNDKNRMVVSNTGRAIIKKLEVNFEGNEI